MLWILPHQFFSLRFSLRSRLSWNFYLKNRRSKTPTTCKVLGLWLHFHAMIRLLCCRSQELFLSYCKKQQHRYLFSVVSQGRKQLASWYANVGCMKWQQRWSYFLCRIVMSKQRQLHFLHSIARERAKTTKIWTSRKTRAWVAKVWWLHNNQMLYVISQEARGQRKMKHFCQVLEWPLLGDVGAWIWPDSGFVQLQKNCTTAI